MRPKNIILRINKSIDTSLHEILVEESEGEIKYMTDHITKRLNKELYDLLQEYVKEKELLELQIKKLIEEKNELEDIVNDKVELNEEYINELKDEIYNLRQNLYY